MKIQPLQFGKYYHIFNRGNNREKIFFEQENYRFFLQRYAQRIEPIAKTYAYCLIPNHFHVVIYTRTPQEQKAWYEKQALPDDKPWQLLQPSKCFSNFFASYSMSINRRYKRTGSLFEKRVKRKIVDSSRYFFNLLNYIHRNAQHHRIVDDFCDWSWSSYDTMLRSGQTRLPRAEVIDWFGDREAFVLSHAQPLNTAEIEHILIEDDD